MLYHTEEHLSWDQFQNTDISYIALKTEVMNIIIMLIYN